MPRFSSAYSVENWDIRLYMFDNCMTLVQIDNLIGEDHLFKRSIILVKAWCFYESRLLGANCNLLSSYALEILVIHIFDIFHESLKGPLQVLLLVFMLLMYCY